MPPPSRPPEGRIDAPIDGFPELFAQRALSSVVATRWKGHGSRVMEAGGRFTSTATDGIVLAR